MFGYAEDAQILTGCGFPKIRRLCIPADLSIQKTVRTMTRAILACILLFTHAVFAATVSCPEPHELSGTFKTVVKHGFTPNSFTITTKQKVGDYYVDLTSYWSAKPFDDGRYGTIGDFSGRLFLLNPWSCVGVLDVSEKERHDDVAPPSCNLLFRFIGKSTVFVESIGQCDYYHGFNANPDGKYVRQK